METKNSEVKYSCIKCHYICSKYQYLLQHYTTAKHKRHYFGNILETLETDPRPTHKCVCGKKYKNRDGLWKHKKKCVKDLESTPVIIDPTDVANLNPQLDLNNHTLIIEVLQQNQEFKELIIEQNKQNQDLQKQLMVIAKEGKHITNNMNNTTNNKFNLNFFLNEQCKDALNIMDFVNSLQLQLTDLERVGKVGYVEGISKIFVNGLKELDIFKRPIHCSDVKRETLYVKDKDAWEKENQKNDKLKLAIKHIAHKNMKQLSEWQEENPEYKDAESNVNDQYLKIVCESSGGFTLEEDDNNYNKIISKVARETMIDKFAITDP